MDPTAHNSKIHDLRTYFPYPSWQLPPFQNSSNSHDSSLMRREKILSSFLVVSALVIWHILCFGITLSHSLRSCSMAELESLFLDGAGCFPSTALEARIIISNAFFWFLMWFLNGLHRNSLLLIFDGRYYTAFG